MGGDGGRLFLPWAMARTAMCAAKPKQGCLGRYDR
jgi:hypothetical protein